MVARSVCLVTQAGETRLRCKLTPDKDWLAHKVKIDLHQFSLSRCACATYACRKRAGDMQGAIAQCDSVYSMHRIEVVCPANPTTWLAVSYDDMCHGLLLCVVPSITAMASRPVMPRTFGFAQGGEQLQPTWRMSRYCMYL